MQTTSISEPKFTIDRSQDKYESRYQRIMNILFCTKEIPSDLYLHMNMSYANFRKTLSILKNRGWIKRINKNGKISYVITTQGKKLTIRLEYMQYRDYLEENQYQYQYEPSHRNRKFQFAYLYALFDRIGVYYESFNKPPLDEADVFDQEVYFYTALEIKRLLKLEATSFKGSRLLGFLIGIGKIIAVYRTNRGFKSFSSVEKLIPLFMLQYFSVPVDTAILICDDSEAAADLSCQIIRNKINDPKVGLNTASYKYFYILPDDDVFLRRLKDIYLGGDELEESIVKMWGIDTSEEDANGRRRIRIGTGLFKGYPTLVCSSYPDVGELKRFILGLRFNGLEGYILCKDCDLDELKEITKDEPIRVFAF